MQKEFEHIFAILKKGSQEEVRTAKKRIDKLWYGDRENFEKNSIIALKQMKEFGTIQNPKNQEAFVSGLSIFFLVLSDTHFKELKNFVLKVICHPNGHVREQMRKTADWLFMSLTSRINPFVYPKGKKLTEKQIVAQEEAKNEFAEYLGDIEDLMTRYDDGSNNRIKYISSLKPSVYKSLQLLWSDLTRGGLHKKLHTPPAVILEKRKEIEKELSTLVKKTKSDISLEEIQDIIYDETDFDDLNNIIRMFDMGSPYELQNVIEILNDAWNYFPHRILNGLCPAEMLHQDKQTKLLN